MKRNQGPKHPKECKWCKWWDPHSEAYACEFCEAKARQDRTANNSSTGQEPATMKTDNTTTAARAPGTVPALVGCVCECGLTLGPDTTTTDLGPCHCVITCRCGRRYTPRFDGRGRRSANAPVVGRERSKRTHQQEVGTLNQEDR